MEEGYKTNLLKRIITSIVIILPIGVILFFDNALGLYLTIFIVSFFAIFEWNKANLDRPYLGFILIALVYEIIASLNYPDLNAIFPLFTKISASSLY